MLRLFLILVGGLLSAGPALAINIVDNLGGTQAGGNLSPQSTFWIAQQFVTDAESYQSVDQVTFLGSRHPSETNLRVQLWTDSGDLPSTLVGDFDGSAITATFGEQPVPSNGTIMLSPNTAYWIVLAPETIQTSAWRPITDDTNIGPGTLPAVRASSGDGGTSWSSLAAGWMSLRAAATVPVELQHFEIE